MKAALLLAVPLMFGASAALAQSMNAEQFYERGTALQKKGAMAIFSMGEVKLLTSEGQAAAQRVAAARKEAVAAGQKPRFCPPPGPGTMGQSEFMQRLGAIPANERSHIDLTEALTRMLAAKYPCKT